MKPTQQQILDYIEQNWINRERFCDLAIYIASFDVDATCSFIDSTGCINSKQCYEYAIPIEKEIEKRAKKFNNLKASIKAKRIDKIFENCLICECTECNNCQFLIDGNEELYPELKTHCWDCKSKKIEVYLYGNYKKIEYNKEFEKLRNSA